MKGFINMTYELEQSLFLKELQRLHRDYQRCEEEDLKKEIMADIKLLSSVISKDHRMPEIMILKEEETT